MEQGVLPDSPAALAATAAIFSSIAASGSLLVAFLSYRSQQPRVQVFLRLERDGDPDGALVVEVANAGRTACTVLRVGFLHGPRLLRQETRHGQLWTYGGPTEDGNWQRHRLGESDATSWHVSRLSLRDALGEANPPAVRAFVQLGDGRLVRSTLLKIR